MFLVRGTPHIQRRCNSAITLNREFKKRCESPSNYSLYIHIPFCFSLCWYCGCTKIITRDQDRGDVYLDYLEKEMELVSENLHPGSSLNQIHFGGGTPTFLNPDQLNRLGDLIRTCFNIHPEPECSVEIDPRRVSEEHVIALAKMGINRASLACRTPIPKCKRPFTEFSRMNKMKWL